MELLKQFEAYLKSTDRSASVKFYCSDIQKFAGWFERRHGEFDPAAITPLDLVEYRGYLQSSGGRLTQAYSTNQPAVRHGKGNKQRQVPLNVTIRHILTDYLVTLPTQQEVLFTSRSITHFSERGVQHLVNRYAYKAKLERVSPHSLRHSFCKNLIDAGVSLDKVALLAGHTSVDVTRRYTTPSEQDLQEAVEHLAWE